MRQIVLTLCVFIALSSLANAVMYYKCLEGNGNVLITDNPPQDAICELRVVAPDLNPMERQRTESEQARPDEQTPPDEQIPPGEQTPPDEQTSPRE